MERFFGGNPALVLIRLAILSLLVTPTYDDTADIPAQRFAWVIVTPLGSPVEPEV